MKKSELEKLIKVKNIALVVDKLSDDEDRYILDIQAVVLHFNKLSANGKRIPYLLDTSFKTVSQAIVRNINDYDINFNNVHVFNSDNILYIKKTFNDTLSCLFPLPVQLLATATLSVSLPQNPRKHSQNRTSFLKCFRNLIFIPSGRESRFLNFLQKHTGGM